MDERSLRTWVASRAFRTWFFMVKTDDHACFIHSVVFMVP